MASITQSPCSLPRGHYVTSRGKRPSFPRRRSSRCWRMSASRERWMSSYFVLALVRAGACLMSLSSISNVVLIASPLSGTKVTRILSRVKFPLGLPHGEPMGRAWSDPRVVRYHLCSPLGFSLVSLFGVKVAAGTGATIITQWRLTISHAPRVCIGPGNRSWHCDACQRGCICGPVSRR